VEEEERNVSLSLVWQTCIKVRINYLRIYILLNYADRSSY